MNRSQALLAAAAVLAAAFFVNLIFGEIGGRADLTADRTFTLSPGSKRIVAKLDETVTLELFVSRSDVKLRPYLESYSRRVETLLREYVAASGGKVRLVVTDPRPDTKEEQRAQRRCRGDQPGAEDQGPGPRRGAAVHCRGACVIWRAAAGSGLKVGAGSTAGNSTLSSVVLPMYWPMAKCRSVIATMRPSMLL